MSNNFKNKVKELYDQKCSKYDNINEKNVLPAVDKIVVIGDIHGDFQKTIECLKLAKVLQEDTKYGINNPKRYKWIGEDTVIVQVGDQFIVDTLSCTLCGICLEVCPTGSISFEGTSFQLEF